MITEHQKDSRTPPGIDEGKPGPFRVVEWRQADLKLYSALVPVGMQVQEPLHAHYWNGVKTFERVFAAWERRGKRCPRVFGLLDEHNKVVGYGAFLPTDGPAEVAWLDCMFAEMRGWKIALELPADVDVSTECERANVFAVMNKEAQA